MRRGSRHSPEAIAKCRAAPRASTDPYERMMRYVSPEPNTGCWIFTGRINDKGYGMIDRGTRVHRLSWTHEHGPIPSGLFVCHHCDNRPCCNPAHLFLGTPKDNMQDMIKKGRKRVPMGIDHRKAKLTVENVHEIRRLLVRNLSKMAIAAAYGIAPSAIYGIATHRTWKHVPVIP